MSYTPPPPPPEPGEPGQGQPAGEGGAPPPGYGSAPPPPPPGGGYGAPGGYGPPGGYGGPPRNNSKAVTALVIGIASPVLGLCCGFFGLIGIVAIFLGRSAQNEIRMSGGTQTGEGMAKAGVILGIIGAVLGVIMTIVNIFLISSGSFDFSTY